jgi:ketosteroid isomerase-like protein
MAAVVGDKAGERAEPTPQLTEAAAREFLARLQAMWLSSDPDHYARICCEDVLLVQPLMPPMRGRQDAHRRFQRLFRQFPDLKVTMTRWGLADDSLLVEYVARGTLGGKPLEWRGVDRIAIRDGLIAHRVAYLDWSAVLVKILRRPRGWPQALRSGLRPRGLRTHEAPQ